jgi:hypothetical protein
MAFKHIYCLERKIALTGILPTTGMLPTKGILKTTGILKPTGILMATRIASAIIVRSRSIFLYAALGSCEPNILIVSSNYLVP